MNITPASSLNNVSTTLRTHNVEQASIKLEDSSCGINSIEERINAYVEERVNALCTVLLSSKSDIAKQDEMHAMVKDDFQRLEAYREETFEYVNKDTDDVYGILSPGKTAADRDVYITRLVEFYQVSKEVTVRAKEYGYKLPDIYRISHTAYIFGDFIALEEARPVPDFQYNAGTLQLG